MSDENNFTDISASEVFEQALSNESKVETSIQSTETDIHKDLDVSGAFSKSDLEWQKKQLATPGPGRELPPRGFSDIQRQNFEKQVKQINYREKTLYSLDNKARDDFNISSENHKDLGLDR